MLLVYNIENLKCYNYITDTGKWINCVKIQRALGSRSNP